MTQLLTQSFRFAEKIHEKQDFVNNNLNRKMSTEHLNSPPVHFSPYQLFACRSILNAVTPWLVMTQTTPTPQLDKSFTIESNRFDAKVKSVSFDEYIPSVIEAKNLFVDPKFLSILVANAQTFKFTQRMTFLGFTCVYDLDRDRNQQNSDGDGDEEEESLNRDPRKSFVGKVFQETMTTVDFHSLFHLDFSKIDHLTSSLLLKITQQPSTSLFARRSFLVQSLDLSFCRGLFSKKRNNNSKSDGVDELAQVFASSFPNLRKLKVERLLKDGLKLCNALTKSVAISSASSTSIANSLEQFILSYASIHAPDLCTFFSKCSKLKKLVVCELQTSSVSNSLADSSSILAFPNSLKKCPLEVIDIHDSHRHLVNCQEHMEKICECFGPNLAVLNIGRTIGHMKEEFFPKYLFPKCPFLLYLGLDDLKCLTVELLDQVPDKLPHLIEIDISDNWGISKKDRIKFNKKHPYLSVQQIFYDITSEITTSEEDTTDDDENRRGSPVLTDDESDD